MVKFSAIGDLIVELPAFRYVSPSLEYYGSGRNGRRKQRLKGTLPLKVAYTSLRNSHDEYSSCAHACSNVPNATDAVLRSAATASPTRSVPERQQQPFSCL